MTVPLESIEVGKGYLADQRHYPQVWRVHDIFFDGGIDYKTRPVASRKAHYEAAQLGLFVLTDRLRRG